MKLMVIKRSGGREVYDITTDAYHAHAQFNRIARDDEDVIGGILQDRSGVFIDCYVSERRKIGSHPIINSDMLNEIRAIRRSIRFRENEFGPRNGLIDRVTGYCHEVSENIEAKYGFTVMTGVLTAKDCKTPLCYHYWNVLPDKTVFDATYDQFMDGADMRIISPNDPDWCRYQPEFDDEFNPDNKSDHPSLAKYPSDLAVYLDSRSPRPNREEQERVDPERVSRLRKALLHYYEYELGLRDDRYEDEQGMSLM